MPIEGAAGGWGFVGGVPGSPGVDVPGPLGLLGPVGVLGAVGELGVVGVPGLVDEPEPPDAPGWVDALRLSAVGPARAARGAGTVDV
ncbi:MAG: hypothetical protein ACTHON_19250, partial [Humibacter sp.]